MLDIEVYFERYCKEHDLEIALSWEMPEGYETAFGSFDPTRRTLFLNKSMLRTAPEEKALFYLHHELRHALQYLRPELFNQQVQTSRFYVVLYNGVCYKLADNTWKMCVLTGDTEYFKAAYLSLPYEQDANVYAYQAVREIIGNTTALRELASAWTPANPLPAEELERLFCLIDKSMD